MITAIGKRAKASGDAGKNLEKLITNKYSSTVHIDNDLVLQINRETKDFREYPLSGETADWSKEVMDAIGRIEAPEKEETP